MSNRVTESELERIRETLKLDTQDPLAAQQWIVRARQDLASLVEDLTDRQAKVGGEFAEQIREAVESRILEKTGGRCQLTSETKEHSVGVQITPQGVFVDVRFFVGIGK